MPENMDKINGMSNDELYALYISVTFMSCTLVELIGKNSFIMSGLRVFLSVIEHCNLHVG